MTWPFLKMTYWPLPPAIPISALLPSPGPLTMQPMTIGEEDDSHLGDFIEDKESESPVDFTTRQLLKEELYSILKDLSDREERVIRLRYGLDDNRPRTLEEVGREFGVTRERIRQIEAKAIKKLRHPTRSKRLGDYKEKL